MTTNNTHPYIIGNEYNRQKDIHDLYGGSRQSGISPSKNHPYVFIFTGTYGEKYGYVKDGWKDNHVFYYTGEGQTGDMQMTAGNKAINEHIINGKSLLLFKNKGKSQPYIFEGEFTCIGFNNENIPDKHDNIRNGIIFHLAKANNLYLELENSDSYVPLDLDLYEMREIALSSIKNEKVLSVKDSIKKYYHRSRDIKKYVLLRANGKCECCGNEAPFLTREGIPFLEVHHIHKLSDTGLDRPDKMAALTPNCHRKIHHSELGHEIDNALNETILNKELEIQSNLKNLKSIN